MATILVVDDNASNRELVRAVLGPSGHTVIEASDGAEGLALTRSQLPDVVVADVLMPRMDGYEFVRRLRSDAGTAGASVIFYTAAYAEAEVRRLADACGVHRILPKPSEPQVILAEVDAALAEGPQAPTSIEEEDFHREHLVVLNEKLLQHEEELSHQALYDSLTGLANRALFSSLVEQALARAVRVGNRVAVLFLDLDNFKGVNDTLGHAAGDLLLVEVARRLKAVVRPADTVARLGGDTFGFEIEDLRGEADASIVARRVLNALRPPVLLAGIEVFPAGSLGGRMSEPGERDPAQLLSDADTAMCAAKVRRKGTFLLFHPDMHREALARFSIESELRAALGRSEIEVHYQPILDLVSGRAVALEALARWNHTERGAISPAEFIPVAEETGLIIPLGRWVLRTALEQLRSWRVEGRATGVQMSVNVTARELKEQGFCRNLRRLLREKEVTPASVTLEITESATSSDAETIAVLTKLKAMGVKLAIDDFGTGFSSLSYLGRLPVHMIKVDKRFVDVVASGPAESAVCRAICSLANALGLELVAEGVETKEQARLVGEQGCRFAQGYLFARPMAAAAAGEFLDKWGGRAAESRTAPPKPQDEVDDAATPIGV